MSNLRPSSLTFAFKQSANIDNSPYSINDAALKKYGLCLPDLSVKSPNFSAFAFNDSSMNFF